MSFKSFVYPQLIFKKASNSRLIEVVERCGRLHLTINGRPQTNPQYQSNWQKLLTPIVGGANRSPYHILVLGLGGGDVIKVVQKLNPEAVVTTVEIDSEVVQLAKKYFGIRDTRKLKIVCEDANKFLRKNKQRYDLVVVDLYDGDEIPGFVVSDKFILKLVESTAKTGSAVFNFASYSFRKNDYQYFQQLLEKYYTSVMLKKYWGHNYYVARN